MVGARAPITPAQSKAQELSPNSRPGAQGLRDPGLTSFQGTGPGKVITLLWSRSRELRGKNVNEDTILNVDSWMPCEPAL